MKQIALILSLLPLLISAGAVMAQEEAALDEEVVSQDLEIQDPTLLPDSPFYFIKSWSRGIQGFFTFNPVDKAALKQRFASEKLIEVKKMIEERRDDGVIGDAIEKYKKEVEEVGGVTEDIKEKAGENEKVASFLDKYIKQQTLHQRLLQKLEEQVPPKAFEKIKAARERHLEKFGEVMNRLEENKERLQQRLEKNLEEVKGSDFKEFKNLEVLKQLEEKVPEQAREAIQRARENTLRRLEIKLEQSPDGILEKFKIYTESISGEKERHEEILENLKDRLEDKPAVQQKIIESFEKVMERIDVKEREESSDYRSVCIQLWDPVCGTDGKTYSNACFAKAAGVEVKQKGACANTNVEIKPTSRAVVIDDFAFVPADLKITKGTMVTWRNEDDTPHTVKEQKITLEVRDIFDSGVLQKSDAFSYQFNRLGTFNYICSIHPSMKGRIIVVE